MTTAISDKVSDKTTRARDVAAVAALIDRSKLSFKGDAVEGVDAEITRLQAAYPGLFFSIGNVNGGDRSDSELTFSSPSAKMASAYADNAATRTGR